MELSEAAKKARREYSRAWREKNREHIRAYARKWHRENHDRVEAGRIRYWERKANEQQKEG